MTDYKRSLALIGTGYWGKNLARNHNDLGSLALMCDQDAEHLHSFKEQYPEVRFSTDWQAVLADAAIDKVAIATPPHTHFDLVKQALQAGKDVFVEKPICHGVDECQELVNLAKVHGRVLMVGHLLQYHPFIRHIEGMLHDDVIGQVQYIESRRCNIGKIYTERNVLWNFGPHDITLVLAMHPGVALKKVACHGSPCLAADCDDAVVMHLTFADGATSVIQLSWISAVKEQRLVVYGEKGSLIFDDTAAWEEKLTVFPGWTGVTDGRQGTAGLPESYHPEVASSEPLREECAHFLECCEQRTEPATGPTQAMAVQRVLEAAQASLDAGGAVIELD